MFLTENANNAENRVVELKTAAGVFLPFKPLKPSADSLPPFPIDCLPSRLRSYVEAVAIHTQTPVDMAAGAALGVPAYSRLVFFIIFLFVVLNRRGHSVDNR